MKKYLAAFCLLASMCGVQAQIIPVTHVVVSPINLSATAYPVSGFAPLFVEFNASYTTAPSVTSQPFLDIEYRWSFGDPNTTAASACSAVPVPGEGYWACGSNPGANTKNAAIGPYVGHVYENPGTYEACLDSAFDGTNTAGPQCFTITVTRHAAANTTCVNATGSDHTGCPLIPSTYANSAACVSAGRCATNADYDNAVSTYINGANKLLAFKGGDTFTATSSGQLVYQGVQMESYGTGQAKVVGDPGGSGYLYFASGTKDARVVNMEFDPVGYTGRSLLTWQAGLNPGQVAPREVLIKDVYAHGFWLFGPIDFARLGGYGYRVINNRFFNMEAGSETDMLYVGAGSRVTIMGNYLAQGGEGQQVVRMNGNTLTSVNNNDISGAYGNGSSNLKSTVDIRGNFTTLNVYNITSDNKITVDHAFSGIYFQDGGGAGGSAGAYNSIAERNLILAGTPNGYESNGIITNARQVAIRNNIIDGTTYLSAGITLRDSNCTGCAAPSIASDQVKVYNNTIYTTRSSGTFYGVNVDAANPTGSGNVVRNNLISSPNLTVTSVSNTGGSGTATVSHNSAEGSGAGSVRTDPAFSNPASPPTGFSIGGGSYAVNAGTAVPVWSDFFGAARTGTYDLGAVNP